MLGDRGGIPYLFDTSTLAGSGGQGSLRFNDSNISNTTELYFDDSNEFGIDQSAWYETWDNTIVNSGLNRGYIYITSAICR
jgi:hypothetical protein